MFSAFDGKSWSEPVELTIGISDIDSPPTDITAELTDVPENTPGYVIGKVTVVDPDGAIIPFRFTR